MKSKLNRIIPAVIVLVVVGGAIAFFATRGNATADESRVKGSGTVEATEIGVAAQSTGQIVTLLVDEGGEVQEGDVIAELDHSILDADLRRAEGAAYAARMQLAELARGARSEEVRARAAVLQEALAGLEGARSASQIAQEAYERPHEYQAALDQARTQAAVAEAQVALTAAQQSEAVAGARSQEITAAEAALAQTAAALAGAEAELAQAERAYAAREAATTEIAGARTQLAVSRASERAAAARQDLVNAPPRPEQREQLSQKVIASRAQLNLAADSLARVERLHAEDAATEQELDAARTEHDAALASFRAAEAALGDLDAGAREMERDEAASAVQQARAVVEGAETAVGNAEHEREASLASARQQLERARAAVQSTRHARDQAAAQVDLIKAGTRDERLAQAQAGVESAGSALSGAELAVANASGAHADRFPLRQQLEAAKQQRNMAEAKVQAARAQLDLALAGNTDETIEMARGKTMEAEAAAEAAAERVEDAYIRAPRAGTVTDVVLREGEMVSPGSIVVRMMDLSNLTIRIYLPTRHFGRVVLGADCTAYADAYPEKGYPARITAVSDESEFTPKNTQTVEERVKQVFWVKVDVGDGLGELKPGMPADVVIETGDAA